MALTNVVFLLRLIVSALSHFCTQLCLSRPMPLLLHIKGPEIRTVWNKTNPFRLPYYDIVLFVELQLINSFIPLIFSSGWIRRYHWTGIKTVSSQSLPWGINIYFGKGFPVGIYRKQNDFKRTKRHTCGCIRISKPHGGTKHENKLNQDVYNKLKLNDGWTRQIR